MIFAWSPDYLLTLFSYQMIKAGEEVIASTYSANRDESVFFDPDSFNIHRDCGPAIGFGYGPHRCIGESLVRATLETVFCVSLFMSSTCGPSPN